MLSFAAICPHPPIIIPSIGAGEAKKVKSTVSAMEQLARNKVAFVASGDLSHRLTPDAPAGYSSSGAQFDKLLVGLLKKGDTQSILKLDPQLIEEAGECGFRSICVLLGVLEARSTESGKSWQAEILSYEWPFGVGYLVANFKF